MLYLLTCVGCGWDVQVEFDDAAYQVSETVFYSALMSADMLSEPPKPRCYWCQQLYDLESGLM